MSSNLKAQLKALLAAKEYRAAMTLLESSTLPDKRTYIERIKKRMAEETTAQAPVKPMAESGKTPGRSPAKAMPARRKTWLWVAAVLMVIVAGCAVIIAVKVSQIDNQLTADTAWIGVEAYCGRILADTGIVNIRNCDTWEAKVKTEQSSVVVACNNQVAWLTNEYDFYDCLLHRLPGDYFDVNRWG